jgi:hypothetical protein
LFCRAETSAVGSRFTGRAQVPLKESLTNQEPLAICTTLLATADETLTGVVDVHRHEPFVEGNSARRSRSSSLRVRPVAAGVVEQQAAARVAAGSGDNRIRTPISTTGARTSITLSR